MTSDLELYRAWTDGDRAAGARLIERHIAAVIRFFANKTLPAAEADDLVATTFERCARSLGGYRGEGSFRGYLLGIALNVLRDELRRRLPAMVDDSTPLADLGPSPSRVAIEREEARLLLAGLRAIPFEYQVVLELHYVEALSRDEAAAVLGLPEGTVASRVRRGRELLAAAVERLGSSPAMTTSTLSGFDGWAGAIRAWLDGR